MSVAGIPGDQKVSVQIQLIECSRSNVLGSRKESLSISREFRFTLQHINFENGIFVKEDEWHKATFTILSVRIRSSKNITTFRYK